MEDERNAGREHRDDEDVLHRDAKGQERVEAVRHGDVIDADDHRDEGDEHDQDIDGGDESGRRNATRRRGTRREELDASAAHGAGPAERGAWKWDGMSTQGHSSDLQMR